MSVSRPFLSLLLALTILGVLIFQRAHVSEQPPFYDALSYAVKAKSFWDTVAQGVWANPLDLRPTVRPPGTILMSYPLGFSEEPQGFYFRSVVLPIVIFALALWCIGSPSCARQRERWLLVALCLAACSLPLFYHFEPHRDLYSPTRFGLVDNFLAAVASLAACLTIRGVQRSSLVFTCCGAVLSAYCLLLKPAGFLVMMVIGVIWLIFLCAALRDDPHALQRRILHRYAWKSVAVFMLVYGAVIGACFNSQYFSPENMVFGWRAADILRAESSSMGRWVHIVKQLHTSLGWQLLVVCFILLVGSSWYKKAQSVTTECGADPRAGWPVRLSAGIPIAVGLWFWLVYTGGNQIRYFYPFALIGLTVGFPWAMTILGRMPRYYSNVAAVFLLLPFFLVVSLVCLSEPSLTLQRILGVNVTSGSLVPEVSQARALISQARSERRDLTVYRATLGPATGMFCGVGTYNKILYPDEPSFTCRTPRDWNRAPVLRLGEIAACDYLLFVPTSETAPAADITRSDRPPDLHTDLNLLQTWLSVAGEGSGIGLQSETSLRLLSVMDRLKFANALERLKEEYAWRKDFCVLNPLKWIDRPTAQTIIKGLGWNPVQAHFEDRFVLEAISCSRTAGSLKVELIWQSLKEQRLEYTNTLYILDRQGKTLFQTSFEQDPAERRVSKGTTWHDVEEIPLRKLSGRTAERIGIRVRKGKDDSFAVEKGCTEMNSDCLIIPLE